jgi:hypothetical protein
MSRTVQLSVPLNDVVSDDADTMTHFEHPADAEEFAAVAVLATLAYAADQSGSALPPLWPRVLHSSFTDLTLPVSGADVDVSSSDVAPISELIRALRSPIPLHQHGGAVGIRRVLYLYPQDAVLIGDVIASGVVPLLARLLGSGAAPHATQFEAAWALAIVASSHTSVNVQCVTNTPGAIKGIVSLVGSTGGNDAGKNALSALRNIATKSSVLRDVLLESGVVAAMLNVASRTNNRKSLRRSVAWTISQLCFPKPPLAAVAPAIPFLIEVSQSPDDYYAANAGMLPLRVITGGGDCDGISAVIEHGALPVIVRRLSSANNIVDVIDALAVNCLGNIVEGNELHIAQAVEHGAIPALCTVWRKRWPAFDPRPKPIVLSILAKIATGNIDHIHAVLQAGALDLMAANLSTGELRQEYQRTVTIALRDASQADCAAIIQSATFQWLISAAQQGHLVPAGVEGLAVAFERAFHTVTTVVSTDALRQLMETLSSSMDVKGECRGAIERIRGIMGGGTGTARSRSPAREARSQGRTASDGQPRSVSIRSGVCALLRNRRLGDTRLLLLAWTGSVLMPFWSIEMVVSAFARVVRPLPAHSDRSA